ncbi:MAG: phosphoglycerate kinase [Phycisphaerae bacterium]
MKRSIKEMDVKGQRVLARLDLNVPLGDDGTITNDRRITACVPTIRHLIEGGARLVLMSHLGRPKTDEDRQRLSLAPVAQRMAEVLGQPVAFVPACIGAAADDAVSRVEPGGVLLLENLRFHEEETIKDKKAATDPELRARKDAFAKGLSVHADAYVNDAFGTCHRCNASMLTVPQQMLDRPRGVGFLVEKELAFLGPLTRDPERPFVCILGGAKVSDKLGVTRALLQKCDKILIGGAMAYTFLAADGAKIGRSLVEPDLMKTARELLADYRDQIVLPVDSACSTSLSDGDHVTVHAGDIPDDLMGLDIGPSSLAAFSEVLQKARTVFWNGPMGAFEHPPFDHATNELAKIMAEVCSSGAIGVVGGGDSAAAVEQAGLDEKMSHVSTGGGASLELLEHGSFAALDVLENR